MRREIRFGHLILGLILAVSAPIAAYAQMGGHRGGANNQNPLANPAPGPKRNDPEARDAIDLFSHLCVSTSGDLKQVTAIIGEGNSAVEKMDAPLLRGLEEGRSGGVGWIIRMPLGEKLLVEIPPEGACIVRAPRVNAAQMEAAFRDLLDQYGANISFKVKREGEQTKSVDTTIKQPDGQQPLKEKVKFHITSYSMVMPDSGKAVVLGLATTESKSIPIQATLSFEPQAVNSAR